MREMNQQRILRSDRLHHYFLLLVVVIFMKSKNKKLAECS